jgi:PKD repeat protein
VSFTIISPTISVNFTQSADTIYEGDQVDFTAVATTDGSALTYAWNFGDGGTGAGETASHIYLTPGTYDVTLTVTDGCGYSEAITIEDAVTVEVSDYLIYLPLIMR